MPNQTSLRKTLWKFVSSSENLVLQIPLPGRDGWGRELQGIFWTFVSLRRTCKKAYLLFTSKGDNEYTVKLWVQTRGSGYKIPGRGDGQSRGQEGSGSQRPSPDSEEVSGTKKTPSPAQPLPLAKKIRKRGPSALFWIERRRFGRIDIDLLHQETKVEGGLNLPLSPIVTGRPASIPITTRRPTSPWSPARGATGAAVASAARSTSGPPRAFLNLCKGCKVKVSSEIELKGLEPEKHQRWLKRKL